MNKILLLSVISAGFVVTMPIRTSALAPQTVSPNFVGGAAPVEKRNEQRDTNSLLAKYRRYQARQYYVYYRSHYQLQWTLEGPHSNRRAAERAARRLEGRGYRTYINEQIMGRRGELPPCEPRLRQYGITPKGA